jgi:hypothetical protein
MQEGNSAGQLRLNAVVTGQLERPRIVGTATLREGLLTHPSLPSGVFDAQGSFKFTANQVSIDEFAARTNYGRVSAEGGVFLEGFRPTRWQVNIAGSGLRLRYPTDVISVVDVDLDAQGRQTSAFRCRHHPLGRPHEIPHPGAIWRGFPSVESLRERTQVNEQSTSRWRGIQHTVKNNLADIVAARLHGRGRYRIR